MGCVEAACLRSLHTAPDQVHIKRLSGARVTLAQFEFNRGSFETGGLSMVAVIPV